MGAAVSRWGCRRLSSLGAARRSRRQPTYMLDAEGKKVPEVCKRLGIAQQTYYRWRQKYGGMAPEMGKELKALQKENTRLKKLVADQALDNAILKEAAKGNF